MRKCYSHLVAPSWIPFKSYASLSADENFSIEMDRKSRKWPYLNLEPFSLLSNISRHHCHSLTIYYHDDMCDIPGQCNRSLSWVKRSPRFLPFLDDAYDAAIVIPGHMTPATWRMCLQMHVLPLSDLPLELGAFRVHLAQLGRCEWLFFCLTSVTVFPLATTSLIGVLIFTL